MIPSLLLAAAAFATPATYTLAPADSSLYVVVYGDRERTTPVAVHVLVVVATDFNGFVTWDPDDLSTCSVQIGFPVTALWIDPPGYRDREALDPEGAVEEDTKVTIFKNMTKKVNLWIEQYTRIEYASTSCAPTEGGVAVTGDLTIRGLAKTVTVPMAVTATAGSFAAKGSFELNHADFGMKPFTYGPLTPKNLEKLKFVVDVKGKAN